MSETNISDFLSKTISSFELDESLWDSNISNHFISREKDYLGREKLDGETITDYLQEQSKELKMKAILIGTADLNWKIFGRPELYEMLAIPTKLPNFLLNGTLEERHKKRKIYEFCDLQSFGSVSIEKNCRAGTQRRFRSALNIPWIILQREICNLTEYCLVPISKLKAMPREQYFILLHFLNELQNISNEAISSNEPLIQPKFLKMTAPMQEDILTHGEKRKLPLEDGHVDSVAQPSKKMKLENGFDEEPVLSDKVIDDSKDNHCPVCLERIPGKGISKVGFQMRFE